LLWHHSSKISDKSEVKAFYDFGLVEGEYKGHKLINHSGANAVCGPSIEFQSWVDQGMSVDGLRLPLFPPQGKSQSTNVETVDSNQARYSSHA